jgi:hypothetical protein
VSTADAPAREAAWLADYNPADGLPALLQDNGGPWQVVQAYWPRTPDTMGKRIYVMRHSIKNERFANVQKIDKYVFRLVCLWPMTVVSGAWEQAQSDFDAALDPVITRIVGPQLDKTHGGRFLSVAEDPSAIEVTYHDPVQTLAAQLGLVAEITYTADDPNYNA